MQVITQNIHNTYKVKIEWTNYKLLYVDNSLWINTESISDIFDISKKSASKIIKDIFFNWDYDIFGNTKSVYNKYEDSYDNYYSLDIVILLWYRLKAFKNTRALISTNNEIKRKVLEYNNSRTYRKINISQWLLSIWIVIKKIDKYFASVI